MYLNIQDTIFALKSLVSHQILKAGFVQRVVQSKFTNSLLEQHYHISMEHGPEKWLKRNVNIIQNSFHETKE
jgi:hypothetical protein